MLSSQRHCPSHGGVVSRSWVGPSLVLIARARRCYSRPGSPIIVTIRSRMRFDWQREIGRRIGDAVLLVGHAMCLSRDDGHHSASTRLRHQRRDATLAFSAATTRQMFSPDRGMLERDGAIARGVVEGDSSAPGRGPMTLQHSCGLRARVPRGQDLAPRGSAEVEAPVGLDRRGGVGCDEISSSGRLLLRRRGPPGPHGREQGRQLTYVKPFQVGHRGGDSVPQRRRRVGRAEPLKLLSRGFPRPATREKPRVVREFRRHYSTACGSPARGRAFPPGSGARIRHRGAPSRAAAEPGRHHAECARPVLLRHDLAVEERNGHEVRRL